MHTATLKKLALALTFWLAVHTTSLHAQILVPSTDPVFGVDTNGLLWDTGTTGSLSLSGAGNRMFWYPGASAFRAGGVDGTQWDSSNIGQYSVAMGFDTTASGNYSVALGFYSTATQPNSVAFTAGSASGYGAASFGGNASGIFAFASGWSTASGNYSTSFGFGSSAHGYVSTAFGGRTTASGYYAMASGYCTTASGYASFAIGAYNVGLNANGLSAPNPTQWNPTDPLFEIGNGGDGEGHGNTSASGPSDALVVYKNGNLTAGGVIKCQPASDIPMYNP